MGLGKSKSVYRNWLTRGLFSALVSTAAANVAPYAVQVVLTVFDSRAARCNPVGIGLATTGRVEAGRAGDGEEQGGMAFLLGNGLEPFEAGHQLGPLYLWIRDRGVYSIE